MITIVIDCGSQNTKGALIRDGNVVAKAQATTDFDANSAATRVLYDLIKDAGVTDSGEIHAIVATGSGRELIEFASDMVNEVHSAAMGTRQVFPKADVVIDMGAESSRAVRVNRDGTVHSYEINDKCASGAGVFIENMARVLEVPVQEMGALSLAHDKEVPMNVQCVVFAESEVISLIHQNESKENIAYGVHAGVANRVVAMTQRLGKAGTIALIGGPGYNTGLVRCLEGELGTTLLVSEDTGYISAIGAAVYAAESKSLSA